MNRAQERGFTLIELLVVISIIGILSATSVMSMGVIRQRAYNQIAGDILHNTEIAMNAGTVELQEEAGTWFWAWSDASGNLNGWRANEFLPGLKVDPNTRVSVNYSSWCDEVNSQPWCTPGTRCCVRSWVMAYHCKAEKVKARMTWNNGEVDDWEWNNWGC